MGASMTASNTKQYNESVSKFVTQVKNTFVNNVTNETRINISQETDIDMNQKIRIINSNVSETLIQQNAMLKSVQDLSATMNNAFNQVSSKYGEQQAKQAIESSLKNATESTAKAFGLSASISNTNSTNRESIEQQQSTITESLNNIISKFEIAVKDKKAFSLTQDIEINGSTVNKLTIEQVMGIDTETKAGGETGTGTSQSASDIEKQAAEQAAKSALENKTSSVAGVGLGGFLGIAVLCGVGYLLFKYGGSFLQKAWKWLLIIAIVVLLIGIILDIIYAKQKEKNGKLLGWGIGLTIGGAIAIAGLIYMKIKMPTPPIGGIDAIGTVPTLPQVV